MPRYPRTDELKAAVGLRLKAARKALGEKQGPVAEAINVSQSALSNWETGGRLADLPAMIRFCDRYSVTLDWLYRNDLGSLRHDLAPKVAGEYARLLADHPTEHRLTA